jgi:tetratricopeptide (TPR) repeat protein
MLGEARQWIASMGWDPDPVWFARGDQALARARELDPDDGFVHYLSATLQIARGRLSEAYAELVAAVTRMPYFSHVYHYFAYLFRLSDMLDEALDAEARCSEIEPNDGLAYTGTARILSLRGDLQGALAALERGRLRLGDRVTFEMGEVTALYLCGRSAELLARFGAGEPRPHPMANAALAMTFQRSGDAARADRFLAAATPYSDIDMDSSAWAAACHTWQGDIDHAYLRLGRAVDLGLHSPSFYEQPELFSPLWDDPRWRPFIEDVRRRAAEHRREFRWPVPGMAWSSAGTAARATG